MTMHEDIEARMTRAFEFSPSADGLDRLDRRVARAMAGSESHVGRGIPGRWKLLRPLPLLAAFLILTGTVAGTLTLLERIASEASAGIQIAWEHGEVLGLRQTDGGVTIALERAYADLNQVVVFFTVEGLGVVPSSVGDEVPLEWTAELRDPTGRTAEQWATTRGGTGIEAVELSANVHTWEGEVAPVAGTWELTFTSIGHNSAGFTSAECAENATDPSCPASAMVEGTWTFQFELIEPPGTLVPTEQAATVENATVTLTELRVSPTMIAAHLALQVDGVAVTSWATANNTLVSIEGPTSAYEATTGYHITQDPAAQGPKGDENEFLTSAGSDVATGSWTVTVPELWYVTDGGGPESGTVVKGPWTLTVDVP